MRAKELLSEGVNVVHSDPNAKEYFTKASQLLADQLGMGGDNIQVLFDQQLPNLGQNGVTLPKGNGVLILITNGLSRAEQLYALAHEMVHAHQIDRGDLKIDTSNGIQPYWKGEPVPLKYNRSSEWENEAHAKEKDLARLIVTSIGNLQE